MAGGTGNKKKKSDKGAENQAHSGLSGEKSGRGKEKEPQAVDESKAKVERRDFKYFNFGRLFLGLFVIFIGLALLGETTGLYHIKIDFWSFWPVIIIALGLSLLSRQGWLSFFIAFVVILLVIALIAISFYSSTDGLQKEELSRVETELVSIPLIDGARSAVIKIKTGAGRLSIGGGGAGLLTGRFDSNFLKLKAGSKLRDGVQEVNLETQGVCRVFSGRPKNDLDLSISSSIPVDLYLETGAMKMEIDLTEIKARKVEIDSGASSLKLALGDLVESSKVFINSGASAVDISIPSSLGARLELKGGLVGKSLRGFKETSNGVYETANYRTADKKIEIFLDIGVSSLRVYQD